MGAFNTLTAEVACPACSQRGTFGIQFAFGNTWQLAYRVGDTLAWGGNDIGPRGAALVRVAGTGGPCAACGADGMEFGIIVRNDRIVAVPDPREGFEVIEP